MLPYGEIEIPDFGSPRGVYYIPSYFVSPPDKRLFNVIWNLILELRDPSVGTGFYDIAHKFSYNNGSPQGQGGRLRSVDQVRRETSLVQRIPNT